MALTATDAEWQRVGAPTACSEDAPRHLAEVACALKASSAPRTLRTLKPQYDARPNLLFRPWGLANKDTTNGTGLPLNPRPTTNS